jgi:hypothetical protein
MKQTLTLSVMNRIAESYVKLALAVGTHDADYVDAYYGPEEWKSEAAAAAQPLDAIKKRAVAALAQVKTLATARMDEMLRLRHQYLARQLESLIARVDILSGRKMTFDEESRALYDAVAPTHEEDYFKEFLQELGALLPGSGPVSDRYEKYKKDFVIPKEKLDTVFMAATAESRKRTKEHIALPPTESFTVEYVTGKSWSGYNWYKGGTTSLIQINTDLPIFIDRAVDLSSHEGYPGHHVYNSLLEQRLVIERKWVEFSVYALYSPQSLIAEGTANYGIDMAFPQDERVEFEREVLFPAAGLDPSKAEQYYRVHAVFQKLSYAGNEAARRYLNGEITREDAARWLTEYALMERERAQQRTRFFDAYRSYVINYNLGKDLVRKYIESRPGVKTSHEKRWKEFEQILSSPRVPSGLRDQGPATPPYQNQ